MVVRFIFFEHPGDLGCVEAHIDLKVRRYVPRAIEPVSLLRAYLAAKVLDVRHTSKNDGLKGRFLGCVPVDVAVSELRKEIKEDLIVCRGVNLINHQHNGFIGFLTPFRQCHKKFVQ